MPRGATYRVTADGVVGISGTPKVLYGMTIQSGATAGVVILHNAADADTAANVRLNVVGTANRMLPVPDIPEGGLYFPAGVFADIDANVTSTVLYLEEVRNL